MAQDQKKSLARPFALVFFGHLAAAAFGALSLWFISQNMTVSGFGLFTLALAMIRNLPLWTTLGLDTAALRETSFHLKSNDRTKAIQIVRATFFLRFTSTLILCIIVFLSAKPLAKNIFHSESAAPLVELASLGIFCASIFNYFKSVLWAYQRYIKSFFAQLIADSVKLGAAVFFSVGGMMTPAIAIAAFGLAPAAGILAGVIGLEPVRFLVKEKPQTQLQKKLLSQSRWFFLSELSKTALIPASIFLVSFVLGTRSAGIYGLALNLTYLFPVFILSLKAVILPHVSRFENSEQLKRYALKSLKLSIWAFIALCPLLFFSGPAITFFFGSRYSEAAPVFNLLFIANIIGVMHTILYFALVSINKARVPALIDLARLAVMCLATFKLLPQFGILAAGVVFVIVNAADFLAVFFYFRRVLSSPLAITNE